MILMMMDDARRIAAYKGKNGGFTLLELLISLTLLVVIVVIAMGAMRLGSRSVAAGEKKMDDRERFRTVLSIIDAQIQSQLPLTYDEEAGKGNIISGGTGRPFALPQATPSGAAERDMLSSTTGSKPTAWEGKFSPLPSRSRGSRANRAPLCWRQTRYPSTTSTKIRPRRRERGGSCCPRGPLSPKGYGFT